MTTDHLWLVAPMAPMFALLARALVLEWREHRVLSGETTGKHRREERTSR